MTLDSAEILWVGPGFRPTNDDMDFYEWAMEWMMTRPVCPACAEPVKSTILVQQDPRMVELGCGHKTLVAVTPPA